MVAFPECHNLQSRAVMKRLGMDYAGEFVSTVLIGGQPGVHDSAPFTLHVALPDTWQRPR